MGALLARFEHCLSWPRRWQRTRKMQQHHTSPQPVQPKVYSWDVRREQEQFDPEVFTFHDRSGQLLVKQPGHIAGQQFSIRNLNDCRVFLLDHIATLMMDDCTNCLVFIGPTQQSVFVRDCKECSVVVSCQQFRVRDCHKLKVMLHCVTQPIIESSTRIKFGCFQFYYTSLSEHLSRANLSRFMNSWSNVYDFSHSDPANFSFLNKTDEDAMVTSLQCEDQSELSTFGIGALPSVVPRTHQFTEQPYQTVFMVVLPFAEKVDKIMDLISLVNHSDGDVTLVHTKETSIHPDELTRALSCPSDTGDNLTQPVFRNPMHSKGKVVALEFSGADGMNVVTQCVEKVPPLDQHCFISGNDPMAARLQRDKFYNYVEIQLH